MLLRGDLPAAQKIMTKIYAHAKPADVELKVCLLVMWIPRV